MDWILTFTGFLLIGSVLFDFLFTTLSGNGAASISTNVNAWIANLYQPRSDNGRRWIGAIQLISTLLAWIILFFIGGLLLFSGFDEMVINSTTKEAANFPERIYFTGYVLSTLGTGDYVPGDNFSRYCTITYAILGFFVLTTAITYIINVMGAANNKKNLAAFISSMGNTPLELYDYFTTTPDAKLFTDRVDNIVTLINTHSSYHICYPIVHYFLSDKEAFSAAAQLASFHEATAAMRITYRDNEEVTAHLERIDRVRGRFLEIARMSEQQLTGNEDLLRLRHKWTSRVPEMAGFANAIDENEKRLGALLQQSGRTWREVYEGID
ncbi:potassium channel family protein [Neolewinella antarctica]|uniref:Potassium channel domain-containing protein n=1 Tax=Neolewinella antarctica TaxID=442734 RepID=A0ABX0X690_9BACT|nr:potassium channel family protein [Neolewinella antarctica]NJC24717.1 hypothetical protein [Neolewinella antarctica]